MQERLEKLSEKLKELKTEMAGFEKDTSDINNRRRRRALHAELIEVSAQYLNQQYQIVDSAARVISANLADFARLAEAVRKAPDAENGAARLQIRIQKNTAVGQSMRNALVQLRSWSNNNPEMARKFKSLKRLTHALDKKITIDKSRLTGQSNKSGTIRSKRQVALDRAVDRLSDTYVEIKAEKEMIIDLRQELAIAIELGQLEITESIARRAMPAPPGTVSSRSGLSSLNDMAELLSAMNESIELDYQQSELTETGPDSSSTDRSPDPGRLKLDTFKNF